MESIFAILGGFHSIGETQGCSNLWFVYSLIVIKILHNLVGYSAKKMWVMLAVSVVCGAVVCGSVEMPKWAVSDAILAMPFYAAGYLLACSCREAVLEMVEKLVRNRVVVLIYVVVVSIVLFLISGQNGQVGMYKGYYGNSMLLFLLGGMLGSVIVFMLSALLRK